MFVRVKFEGGRHAAKFTFIWIILNILIYSVWIFNSVVSLGKEFLEMFSESLNTGVWNLLELLTPVGLIILYYVVVQIVLAIIGLALLNNFLNRQ